MPEVLNAMKIDVACYGNHDFDFGESRLNDLSDMTSFPWTLTNVLHDQSQSHSGQKSKLLARAHEYVVREVAGLRIGFFGLAGTDWPSNCQHLPSCDIKDPAVFANRTARQLRERERCDLVIALTHMRLAEDMAVSKNTHTGSGRIDLLLGGHDHDIVQRAFTDSDTNPNVAREGSHPGDGAVLSTLGDVHIVKSGTDWRGLSIMRLRVAKYPDGTSSILHTKLTQVPDIKSLPNYAKIPPCPNTSQVIAGVQAKVAKMVAKPLVMTDAPLEGRTAVVRSREANLGNMLADIVRSFYNTDIAFVNSGAIRCDRIINPGPDEPMLIRDIIDISPFDNAFVVKRVSGRVLAEALENSVSNAHTDGRFLQTSGLGMTVDWTCSEGKRVSDIVYMPRNSPPRLVAPETTYTVAMVDFIASGFDGYSCFRAAESLVDAEGAMTDTNLLLQVFESTGEGDKDDGGCPIVDENTEGIRRAQKEIILRRHPVSGLPVVSPCVEGRIKVINRPNL